MRYTLQTFTFTLLVIVIMSLALILKTRSNLYTNTSLGVKFVNRKTVVNSAHISNKKAQRNPLILFYSKNHGGADWGFTHTSNDFKKCQYNQCLTTPNKSRLHEADMLMFESMRYARHLPNGDVNVGYWRSEDLWPQSSKRPPGQTWTFFGREPQAGGISSKAMSFAKFDFNYTVTFQQHADIFYPYGHAEPLTKSFNITQNFAKSKNKTVLWIVSNCYSQHRMNYYKELKRFIPVDMFGRCNTEVGDPCNRKYSCMQQLKRQYKFYLSFENNRCRDYITEKFWKALNEKMVPIAMGAAKKDYDRVAPPHSFIHVDDFASPEQLAKFLHVLDKNDTMYNEYHSWRKNFRIGWEKMNCQLCELATLKPRNIVDIEQSWNTDTQCW